jgi:hypothetical protein
MSDIQVAAYFLALALIAGSHEWTRTWRVVTYLITFGFAVAFLIRAAL